MPEFHAGRIKRPDCSNEAAMTNAVIRGVSVHELLKVCFCLPFVSGGDTIGLFCRKNMEMIAEAQKKEAEVRWGEEAVSNVREGSS